MQKNDDQHHGKRGAAGKNEKISFALFAQVLTPWE
jgi:hypothetical protein